jgi:hypothetical protein
LKSLHFIFVAALLTACSQENKDLISLREQREGIIIKTNEDGINKIESTYNVESETLSLAAGLYLVKGLSQDDVRMLDVKAETFQNPIIDIPKNEPKINFDHPLRPLEKYNEALDNHQKQTIVECNTTKNKAPLSVATITTTLRRYEVGDRFAATAENSISNRQLRILKTSNDLVLRTKNKITVNSDILICREDTPELLKAVCMHESKHPDFVDSILNIEIAGALRNGSIDMAYDNLRYMWIIEDPVGKATASYGETIEINPNRVGEYTMHLLTRDLNSSGCSLDTHYVRYTANPGLDVNVVVKPRLKDEAVDKFFHLKKLQNLEARKKSTGKGVVIATIDSGINYNHPSLRPNLKFNEKEIPNNQKDDDGNGIEDDYIGYDFNNLDAAPFDDDNHGTHVTAIAAATDVGIAPDAQIIPIKAIPGDVATILRAMQYAIDQKADVVNMSMRLYATDPELIYSLVVNNPFDAMIRNGIANKTIFVLAAGNEGFNNDMSFIAPAKSDAPNAITVGSIDENEKLTDYSNFGVKHVDIATYGGTKQTPIFSANLHSDINLYVGLSGTSMATPIIAGIVAQIKEILPDASPDVISLILKRSSISNETLKGKTVFEAHANSLNAVNLALQIKASSSVIER